METLKRLVETLQDSPEKVKLLQEINTRLLSRFKLKIAEGFYLYPLEVEAYYNDGKEFADDFCHCNKLQCNRFGKLYFHHSGKTIRSGMDLCLSTRDNIYYSILIRSARINNEAPIIGPHKIVREILDEMKYTVEELQNDIVLEACQQEDTPESLVFHGERIGLNDSSKEKYRKLNLRSLKELKAHPFKDKEKILTSHIKALPMQLSGNPEEQIKNWLGYKSKALTNLLKLQSTPESRTWFVYTTANPVLATDREDSALLIEGFGKCLTEFFENTDRTCRTKLIKKTLTHLGVAKQYETHCNGLEDNPGDSELLYDFMWHITDPTDQYIIKSCPLTVECEWKSKTKKDSLTPYSGIKYDFRKLLLSNSDLRLMIFLKKNPHQLEDLDVYFEKAINSYPNLSVGSRFLFIAFDPAIKGFHYTEKIKKIPSDTDILK